MVQIPKFDLYKLKVLWKKGENPVYKHFLLFLSCFQKPSFLALLTLSQTSPGFNMSENTVGKGEIACNEQFLLFPQCFLPV